MADWSVLALGLERSSWNTSTCSAFGSQEGTAPQAQSVCEANRTDSSVYTPPRPASTMQKSHAPGDVTRIQPRASGSALTLSKMVSFACSERSFCNPAAKLENPITSLIIALLIMGLLAQFVRASILPWRVGSVTVAV